MSEDPTMRGMSVVIVGAGVAGLTAADRLSERGAAVTVVEREAVPGGLARSWRHQGVTFDIGPHRFHTEDQEVERYIRDALGRDQRVIDRSSAVWLYNAYHDWPLGRASLLKLPPLVMAQAFVDLFRRPKVKDDESLEAYILSRYGQTLYEIFFRPYTEKFLTYRCSELHRDWASAGINRAVIDQRYKMDSLFHVARTTLLPPPVHTTFLYPDSGGIDRFAESLAERVRGRGGQVLTSAPVESIERTGERVTALVAGGERHELDQLIWTAPLPRLLELCGLPHPGLRYLTELIYNFTVAGRPALPYQWTYYGGAALSFMRASLPSHFSPNNDAPGLSGVCLEVVSQEGDEVWDEPERLRRSLEHDLVRVGLVRRREDIREMFVERVPEVYPIYTLDYAERLKAAVEQASSLDNLRLLGRTGTFWYNNMDHSIRQALDLSEALTTGQHPRQWNAGLQASREL